MRIFDAHFHIIDFPIKENHGYTPPNFIVEDYQNETTEFNVLGGAIVSGSFQGFDQEYLLKVFNNFLMNRLLIRTFIKMHFNGILNKQILYQGLR